MAASDSDASAGPRTIVIPPGAKRAWAIAFAVDWAAYDALSPADGWIERTWAMDPWKKERVSDGVGISVFPPYKPRDTDAA